MRALVLVLLLPLTWVRHELRPPLEGWRMRFAAGPAGELYLGGVTPAGAGQILQLAPGGTWAPVPGAPELARRTYALAVDPAGGLWVASYLNALDPAERRVKVHRYDGARWRQEEVPGEFWPQAMAMGSTGEGWIAGNGGRFRVRRDGRWREAELEGWTGDRPPDVLGLSLAGPDDGWAVGNHGLVARLEGGRWRALESPAPGVQLLDVEIDPAGRIYVSGAGGLLLKRMGERWERIATGYSENLWDLVLTGEDAGWVAGSDGALLRIEGGAARVAGRLAVTAYAVTTTSDALWVAGPGFAAASRVDPTWLGTPGDDPRLRLPTVAGREVTVDDLDGDGDLDLYLAANGRPRLLAGDPRAGFRFVDALPTAPDGVGRHVTAAWGDADGDGDQDLAFVGGSPPALYVALQRGDLELDPPRRLPGPGAFGELPSLMWLDVDGDGHLDLYAGRGVGVGPSTLPNLLYRGNGAGGFRLDPGETGTRGMESFLLAGDLDGDLLPEIVLPGTGRETHVVPNVAGTLVDPPATASLGRNGGASVLQGQLVDFDGDGDLDLGLLSDRLELYANDGAGRLVAAAAWGEPAVLRETSDASRACAAGDLDLDGRPELLWLATAPERESFVLLSPRTEGEGARDRTAAAGLAGLSAEAAVFADLDDDLDLDLVLVDDPTSLVLENRLDPPGGLAVTLLGARSNRRAVGAQVRLWGLDDGDDGGQRTGLLGHRAAGLGSSNAGVPPSGSLLFARPPERTVEVEVTFPGGRRVSRRVEPDVERITVAELPGPARIADRAVQAVRRTVLGAEPLADGAFAVLAIALVTALGGRLGIRLGLETLFPRRATVAGLLLLAAVLRVAGGATPNRPAELSAFLAVVLPLAVLDHRLTAWRRARHVGPYRLLEPLGEGGMGVVLKARHVVSGRLVALKLLHPRHLPDERARRRFLFEAQAMARLDHPNIVRVVESGEVDGRSFIALDLLAGFPLAEPLARGERLSPAAARGLLTVAAEALQAVHGAGLVHRDIKPGNLFLLARSSAGGSGSLPEPTDEWRSRLRLMDFGLARGRGAATATGVAGTPAYLAPEQLTGGPIDARADLYALGRVVREALGPELGSAREPADLAALLTRLTSPRPDERPASAAALLAELRGEVPNEQELDGSTPWSGHLERARRELAAGRPVAAHVEALAALAQLRREVEDTPSDRSDAADPTRLARTVDSVLELVAKTGRRA